MGVTVRPIEWRAAFARPAAMPSVLCPRVLDWKTRRMHSDWLCVSACLPCAYAQGIEIDCKNESGKVLCAAS